jgi:hypothetical protein
MSCRPAVSSACTACASAGTDAAIEASICGLLRSAACQESRGGGPCERVPEERENR